MQLNFNQNKRNLVTNNKSIENNEDIFSKFFNKNIYNDLTLNEKNEFLMR